MKRVIVQVFTLCFKSCDVSLIGETEIAPVSDDQVLMDRHADTAAGEDELPGHRQILFRWPWIPGWVVVGKDHRRGMMTQCRHDDLPGVHTASCQCAFKEGIDFDDPVFRVQEHRDETFLGVVANRELEKIEKLFRIADRVTIQDFFSK